MLPAAKALPGLPGDGMPPASNGGPGREQAPDPGWGPQLTTEARHGGKG